MEIEYENWKIVKKLGTGSFGSVYEIERNDYGVYKAALKVVSLPQRRDELDELRSIGLSDRSISDYYGVMVDDIVKEFALMSELKGVTNIVNYEDHKVVPHKEGIGWDIYIRMELLTPLDKLIQERPLTESDVIRLGMDICNALERCRKLHIIHRDIKPGNIFISKQGDYKLGDFGIARTVEQASSNMSRIGTSNYMAPEVFNGLAYGLTVDIYSLGLVMYTLLNHNRPPFLPFYPESVNYQDHDKALAERMSGSPLPYPNGEVTPLGSIILKACAFEPEDRFQTPEEFRHALELVAENPSEQIITFSDVSPQELREVSGQEYNPEPTKIFAAAKNESGPLPVAAALPSEKASLSKKNNNRKKYIWIAAAALVVILLLLLLPLPKQESANTASLVTEQAAIRTDTASNNSVAEAEEVSSANENAMFTVADYTGKMAEDVQKELEENGLKVKIENADGTEAEGTILKQSVDAGTSVSKETVITLTASRGNQIIMPSFRNRSVKKVKASLKEADVVVAEELKYHESVTPGNVVSAAVLSDAQNDDSSESGNKSEETALKKGDVIEKDSTIKLYTCGIRLPENLAGMSEEEARETLTALGLAVSDNNSNNYDYSEIPYGCVMRVLDESGTAIEEDALLKKDTPVTLQINLWVYQEPVYEEPVYQEPVVEQPVAQPPETEAAPPPGVG